MPHPNDDPTAADLAGEALDVLREVTTTVGLPLLSADAAQAVALAGIGLALLAIYGEMGAARHADD